MKSLYNKETYFKDKKRERNFLIISIAVLFIGLTFFFLSAFLIKNDLVLVICVIDSILLSLTLISFFYILFEVYNPLKKHNRFVYRLLTMGRYQGMFIVKDIVKPYIIQKGVIAYELIGVNDEGKTRSYYLESKFSIDFKVGDTINITVANNFIVEINEVKHD